MSQSQEEEQYIEIMNQKLNAFYDTFRDKRVIVAFTGGLGSSILVKLISRVCSQIICVFVDTDYVSPSDRLYIEKLHEPDNFEFEVEVIKELGISSDILILNSTDRDFFCKKGIVDLMEKYRIANDFDCVADGTNYEHYKFFWSGRNRFGENYKMIFGELKINSHDLDLIVEKNELKIERAHEINLLSRFVYNFPITKELLENVEKAEKFITENTNISLVRVRVLDPVHALIEVPKNEISSILDEKIRRKIYEELENLGFKSVGIDLAGYRINNIFKPSLY